MSTGKLLKSLLGIAGVSQKAFAEDMFVSPSKLSKLINGNILLSAKEANSFIEGASYILSKNIYETNCHLKLQKIFPFILNFSSRHDLYEFFFSAFEYTLTLDREASDKAVSVRTKADLYYSGIRKCQYMFCIICSDYLLNHDDGKPELFSSMPQFCGFFADVFGDLVISLPPVEYSISLQQFCSPLVCRSEKIEYRKDSVEKIFIMEKYLDPYFWQVDLESPNHFLLLKDRFLILFNRQIDDIPQMTLTRNSSHLDNFYEFIKSTMTKADCRSFRQDNLEDFFVRETDTDEKVREKLWILNSLAKSVGERNFPNALQFFDRILEDEASFYITTDALESFLFSKNISGKLFKSSGIPLQLRQKYLEDFDSYLKAHKHKRINIIESQLFGIIVLCQGTNSLICLINIPENILKFHIIQTEIIASGLAKVSSESAINPTLYINNLLRLARRQH